jgi:hypothetical protein
MSLAFLISACGPTRSRRTTAPPPPAPTTTSVDADLPVVVVPTEEVLREPDDHAASGGVNLNVTHARMPPEIIQRIVRANAERLRVCYQKNLSSSPNPRGRVTMTFIIDRDGTVSAAMGEQEHATTETANCVASVVETLRFPRCEETTTVTYPISFTPGG